MSQSLVTVKILNNFLNGWSATFKLNLTRCFPYFAFDQFTWTSHELKSFAFRGGQNTLCFHNSCASPVIQFFTTREYRWGNSPVLFYFFFCVIVFTTPNTYTGYSTNITLTFTLTIYLLTTLLIHALLYNTILKKTLKKCSRSHGLVNSVSVLLS